MHNLIKLPLRACALSLVIALGALGSSPSNAATTRFECAVEGAGDISMHARFERRDNGRRKFSAEFEAAPGQGFTAGQRMTVFVAGFNAGSVRLVRVAGGDVVGDLNLDTTAGPGDEAKPFPAGFPQVLRNTRVLVRVGGENVLACRLQ